MGSAINAAVEDVDDRCFVSFRCRTSSFPFLLAAMQRAVKCQELQQGDKSSTVLSRRFSTSRIVATKIECLCVAAERVARLEKEAQSLKRVSEEVFRVQKQIDSEKLERESASGQLQSDLQQLLSRLPATSSSCMTGTPLFIPCTVH